jgi:hypothetical protein
VGDTSEMLDKHNMVDLSEGILKALGHLTPTTISGPDLKDLKSKIGDLADLIKMVDKDHQEVGRYLLRKLRGIPLPQDQGQ